MNYSFQAFTDELRKLAQLPEAQPAVSPFAAFQAPKPGLTSPAMGTGSIPQPRNQSNVANNFKVRAQHNSMMPTKPAKPFTSPA